MKLATSLFVLCIAFSGSAMAAEVYPIEFDRSGVGANLSIMFVDQVFEADETWYVTGKCENVGGTTVAIVDSVFAATITVKVVANSKRADREICVTNPKDAPVEIRTGLLS